MFIVFRGMFIVFRGIVYAMYIVTEDGSDHLR